MAVSIGRILAHGGNRSNGRFVGTTGPDGRPHATPVWGVWLHGRLYFGGSPETRRGRNLAVNTSVVVHLESGSEVVILHGEARIVRVTDRALAAELAAASTAKYGMATKPEDYDQEGVYVVVPRVVMAWSSFPKDATRWTFDEAND